MDQACRVDYSGLLRRGGVWCSCLMGGGVCAFAAGSAGWVLEMFDRADAYSARFVLSKPQSNIQIQVGRFT